MKTPVIFISLLLLIVFCCEAQKENNKNCYCESLNDSNYLSAQIDSFAIFKCGAGSLKEFLGRALNFDDLPEFDSTYKDTLKASFVINKNGQMSRLQVKAEKSLLLEKRIQKLLVSSACNWTPGQFNGQFINGWYELYIYCTFNRQADFGWINIDYKICSYIEPK